MICPKCGSSNKHLSYHSTGWASSSRGCSFGDVNKQSDEHLHYYCQLCHYDWTGPTRDKVGMASD